MAAISVTVSKKTYQSDEAKPSHHKGKYFVNYWDSFDHTWGEYSVPHLYNLFKDYTSHPLPEKDELPQVIKPDWGRDGNDEAFRRDIKATWLGHACFLVEFPSAHEGKRGFRVLFDPVFSHRCSPSQYVGPQRYTPPPIDLAELPEVDVCVLSHNHYDHSDINTLKHIYKTQSKGSIHFFVPLQVKSLLSSIKIQDKDISEFDWWDSGIVTSSSEKDYQLRVTATPAQHFSGRGVLDRNQSLWASWAVEQLPVDANKETVTEPLGKVWFGGDTGYRAVPRGVPLDEEHKYPHNPEFKNIGDKFGGFDVAMIPIGAYSPRFFFSRVHASPEDAVGIHRDVGARKSVGMHWGTWQLTDEEVNEPKKRLAAAVKAVAGMKEDEFTTLPAIGATLRVQPH